MGPVDHTDCRSWHRVDHTLAVTTIDPPAAPTTLRDVRQEIPRELLEPDTRLALRTLVRVAAQVVVATMVAAGTWSLASRGGAWLLVLPVSWAVGSIAACALFVAGHDCGHRSFLRSGTAMEVIGHLCMAPVLYPFWSWKYSHDAHHRHTNLLVRSEGAGVYFDNAWNPYAVGSYLDIRSRSRVAAGTYKATRLFPPLGSFLHMLAYHWWPLGFRAGRHRNRVIRSIVVTAAVSTLLVAGLWSAFGTPLAVLHFWLLPALGFHAWMALYTFLHHTSDDVTFLTEDRWNPFAAQMDGTINVLSPRWLSYLHLAIDVHIPHHVSTRIPSYHLREANAALAAGTWGHHMRERSLTLGYLRRQVRSCHLWSHEDDTYRRFADADRTN